MTADLIARLEKLTAPDRETDARIALAAGFYKLKYVADMDTWAIFEAPFERGKWAAASGMKSEADAINTLSMFLSLRRYTGSMDAAIALGEHLRPGKSMSTIRAAIDLMYERGGWEGHEVPGMLPRFYCLSALRSLEAEGARDA